MFRPSLHGWPFGNTYTCTGPELGLGGPPPQELGLAGGLCWTALDRYLRGAPIPRDTPPPEAGDPLHAELVQRQVAALAGVWSCVREWHAAPAGSWRDRVPVPIPLRGTDLASRTRAEWRGIRRRLDAGEPVLLTVLPRTDAYRRPGSATQVLATDGSRAGRQVTLSIYDPDCPLDDDIRLIFNLAGALDARISGGRRLRGFFSVSYDRATIPTVRTEAFDSRSVIGLNRKVRGRAAPVSGRKRLDLVARNDHGALLHFHRERGSHWEGGNVTEVEEFGADELHSDPTALRRAGVLHVFARSYVGDLLHFRLGRSWSLTNRTERKRAGARFRLAGRPVPVAGPWLELSVVGRDPNGGLVHYTGAPFRGWRAEQVAGDPMATDPVPARNDRVLHVVSTAHDGRILHWCRDDSWSISDTDVGAGPEVRLAGSPTLMLREGRLHVFGRDREDRLALLTLHPDGEWHRALIAQNLAGDPAAATGPAGPHVLAPTSDGGLVHAWPAGDGWEWEDIVASRPTIPAEPAPEADLAVWGSPGRLRAFVRVGSALRVFTWTADADWTADPVTNRAGDAPVLIRDDTGAPHAFFSDRGTVVHVETGAWREPEPTGQAASATHAAPATSADTADAERPEPEPPEADGNEADHNEAAPLDFEMERLATPPGPSPKSAAAPVPRSAGERDAEAGDPEAGDPEREDAEPRARPEAEDAALLDIELLDPDAPNAAPEARDSGRGGSDAEESGSSSEFRWHNPKPARPQDIEPMDLSLLDTWPPPRRRDRKRQSSGSGDREDEAS